MKLIPPLLFSLSLALAAQDKPKDPFQKVPAAPPAAPSDLVDLTLLVETITLPQADYAAWLDVPADREKLHERAVEAVQKGSAKLDGLNFVRTREGNRFHLKSVDELRTPTEWDGALESGYQHPTAFETYLMGDELEAEIALDGGGRRQMNHSLRRERFLGLRPVRADSTPPHVMAPDFLKKHAVSASRLLPGVPLLLATYALEGQITLVFGTQRDVGLVKAPVPADSPARNLLITARAFSLDRIRAWEMLRRHREDSAACLKELQTMLAAKEAVQEHVSTVTTLSGQSGTHTAGRDYIHGSEFNPPMLDIKTAGATDGQAGHSAFTDTMLGYNWTAEPAFDDENGVIATNLNFANVTYAGDLKDANWSPNYPQVPVFARQQILTSLRQAPGSTVLVSTFSPPGDTGVNDRQDTARVWLLFLETSAK